MSARLWLWVLLCGAHSAIKQGLIGRALADLKFQPAADAEKESDPLAYAFNKWRRGGRTYHLTKNIGQELYQLWNGRDDIEHGGEDGKFAYKVSAFAILAAFLGGLILGAALAAIIAAFI